MATALAPSLRRAREPQVPRRRFRVASVVLAAIGLVGLSAFLFVQLVLEPPAPPPAWSTWEPTAGNDGAKLEQIAAHVRDAYALESELVGVTFGLSEVNGEPLSAVSLFTSSPTTSGPAEVIRTEDGPVVVFQICGGGAGCSLTAPPSTPDPLTHFHREAVALGLYTFKHTESDFVITLLPAFGKQAALSVLMVRDATVEKALRRPLAATIAQVGSPLANIVPGAESGELTVATAYTVERGLDGGTVLVLLTSEALLEMQNENQAQAQAQESSS